MKDELINSIIYGTATDLSDSVRTALEARIKLVSSDLDKFKEVGAMKKYESSKKVKSNKNIPDNSYTDIIKLINDNNNQSVGDFNTILDNIFEKNKKYFSILKDYEIMPILIPQINRILMFLVNECISPDLQSARTFNITCTSRNSSALNIEIEKIRKELELDNLLKNVYMNRFKLGREYYAINNYKDTFKAFKNRLESRPINEAYGQNKSEIDYLNECFADLKIVDPTVINESTKADKSFNDFNLSEMNITIEKTDIFSKIGEIKYDYMNETYRGSSIKSILNEAVGDVSKDKIKSLLDYLSKKDIDNCSITRLDPARVFKLSPSRKTVGYFYITDNNPTTKTNSDVQMGQLMRDRLLKSRQVGGTGNNNQEDGSSERTIIEKLSEKIINTFDPNIGINNIEDIDLLHDYLLHNNIMAGNKKIIFYYADDIIDLSRNDESILINAVFFTKLYSTLLLNNITTKILRGRGRQIHTVNVGVSPSMGQYIQSAIASLTMPQNNLGSITGSFRTLLNPLNSSADIVLPAEEGTDKFITTDLIEGQNVDMDMDILKFLMNSIVMSFGLDSAVIDTTNGNIDFAKTLSMLSYQIANSVRSEQSETLPPWEKLILSVLEICGSTDLVQAISNGEIECSFFAPHSLTLGMSVDELNNVKQFAETVAEVYPELQVDDANLNRSQFIFDIIREEVNLDWAKYDSILQNLDTTGYKLRKDVKDAVEKAKDNITEEELGGTDDESSLADDDDLGDDI